MMILVPWQVKACAGGSSNFPFGEKEYRQILGKLPSVVVEALPGGHMGPLEFPEMFSSEILKFVQAHARGNGMRNGDNNVHRSRL